MASNLLYDAIMKEQAVPVLRPVDTTPPDFAPAPITEAEAAAMPVLRRASALRFLLTRAWDWLNTPADALVTRKDPMAFARRLIRYREAE